MEVDIFDLEASVKVLAGKFKEIKAVYLFGSRRFETGSSRSDIDILLEVEAFLKPSLLRDFTLEHSTALDLFILENGRATSVANESYIQASTNRQLISDLNAVLLYEKDDGSSEELERRKSMHVDRRVQHVMTCLPNSTTEYYEVAALKKYFRAARENGLTAKPYLGVNTEEASEFIIEVMRSLISSCHSVTNYGAAKTGWTTDLSSEYDFQNLFWVSVKPWLPQLGREGVEIKYDDQEKRSDFNLFENQLVIELKHIKNDSDKRAVVKTLGSLKDFYLQHPNVRTLIFGILVDEGVELDSRMWESDFSFMDHTPSVRTVVIRNSKQGG